MVGEKKPLGMSELGCADGCGREMGAENCADGCGRRVRKGVAGNGWGEEAAGGRSASLAARTAADGKWVRRIARTAADGVGAREWLEMGGEKNKMQPTNPNAHTYGIKDMQSLRTIFCNSLFEQFCIYIFPLLPVCSVEWAV